MAQRQFRSDDSSPWGDRYGSGSDGVLTISANTTDATPKTTATATLGSTSLTAGSGTGFAAGNLILIHQSRNGGTGVGNWELNKISSVGGGTNWTLAYPTIYAYDTTAQVYLLKQYSSVTINSGVTLTSSSWGGTTGGILVLLCNGTTTITGTLNSSGISYRGGVDVNLGNATGYQGEGTPSAGTNLTTANGNGGGGGGGGLGGGAGSGGGGGHSSAGGVGGTVGGGSDGAGGAGGGTGGISSLTTMIFGGGGGSGGSADPSSHSGPGGQSGGILIIISKIITITGSINLNGANGTNSPGARSGGGGGAAGGSGLLKGQIITLGSNLITATGGGGGTGDGGPGGTGGTGRIHADYSATITGTTNPTIDTRQDSILADTGGSFLFNLL